MLFAENETQKQEVKVALAYLLLYEEKKREKKHNKALFKNLCIMLWLQLKWTT